MTRLCHFFAAFLLLMQIGYGQDGTLIEIDYAVNLTVNPYLPVSETNTLTVYQGKSLYQYEKLSSRNQEELLEADGMGYLPPSTDEQGWAIMQDLSNRRLIQRRFFKGTPLLVHDSYSTLAWIILDETKVVGSLSCQKAIGMFRGRTYTAWFSMEIPLPIGPWKLGGLPGAILEATDETGEVSFLFSGIRISPSAQHDVLELPPTDEEFESLQVLFEEEDRRNQARARMIEAASDNTVKITITRDSPGERLAIEQIYEWEEQ